MEITSMVTVHQLGCWRDNPDFCKSLMKQRFIFIVGHFRAEKDPWERIGTQRRQSLSV